MKPFFTALIASLLIATPSSWVSAQPNAETAQIQKAAEAWSKGKLERALKIWGPLADQGNAEAQFKLGQAYKLGQGVPANLPLALEWFRKAGAQGHIEANDNAGLLLVELGYPAEALPLIRASAERGEPHALYLYATSLFNGDLVERDWVQAYALMTRAARAGVTQARPSLVQMDRYMNETQRQQGLARAALATTSIAPRAGSAEPPAYQPIAIEQAQEPEPAHRAALNAGTAQIALPASAASTSAPEAPVVQTTSRAQATINLTDIQPSSARLIAVQPASATETIKDAVPVAAVGPARPRTATATPILAAQPSLHPAKSNGTITPSAGRWRIQLGAFREEGRAQALWRKISSQINGLAALKPTYVPSQGLTRLLVGPLANAEGAHSLCTRVIATGTPCLVVEI